MAGPHRALEEQPMYGSKGAFSIFGAEMARLKETRGLLAGGRIDGRRPAVTASRWTTETSDQ
jgi:hypothetical protein